MKNSSLLLIVGVGLLLASSKKTDDLNGDTETGGDDDVPPDEVTTSAPVTGRVRTANTPPPPPPPPPVTGRVRTASTPPPPTTRTSMPTSTPIDLQQPPIPLNELLGQAPALSNHPPLRDADIAPFVASTRERPPVREEESNADRSQAAHELFDYVMRTLAASRNRDYVRDLQSRIGVSADGRVGPLTARAIYEITGRRLPIAF
jgi:hypothetical protein